MYVARRIRPEPPQRPYRHFAYLGFRWEAGSDVARVLYAELVALGVKPFLDYRHIRLGRFDPAMLPEIEQAPNYILVLGPGALDRCGEADDWLRREVAHAIRTDRNLVPILTSGFRFPQPAALPRDLAELPRYNCVEYAPAYLAATMDKVMAFCSISGDAKLP